MRRQLAGAGIACAMAVLSGTAQAPQPVPVDRENLLLAVDRLMDDRWNPGRGPLRIEQDQKLLAAALKSTQASLRALGVRSLGRFENALDVPTISTWLGDSNQNVRCEAANAMVMATHTSKERDVIPAMRALLLPYIPPAGSTPTTGANAVQQAAAANGGRGNGRLVTADGLTTVTPNINDLASCQLDALARLNYDRETASKVLRVFAPGLEVDSQFGRGRAPGRAFGGEPPVDLAHVLPMLRRDPTLTLDDDSMRVIRKAARISPIYSERLQALEILGLLQDPSPAIFAENATFHCPPPAPAPCGWEVRLLGVRGLDPSVSSDAVWALNMALHDSVDIVRVEALRRYAMVLDKTHDCEPLTNVAWNESEPTAIRQEAIRLLDKRCGNVGDIVVRLKDLTKLLGDNDVRIDWPLPTTALETLASLDLAAAEDAVTRFVFKHKAWQVRSAAVRIATLAKDEPMLLLLSRDAHVNVRYEVLKGLVAQRSSAVTDIALADLDTDDDQLIAGAASAFLNLSRSAIAIDRMANALMRLTTEGRDTSRTSRLAILERLKARAPPPDLATPTPLAGVVDDLQRLLTDFDPLIVAKALEVLTAAGSPRGPSPIRREPQQPTVQQLKNPPECAVVLTSDGSSRTFGFLPNEAPLAVARFESLAKTDYFNGFPLVYRVTPFETAFGGSPHGNDMSGEKRWLRDEIGMVRHTPGAISLMTHGRDTGAMRFRVDALDQPKLDYESTIFAMASAAGMLLEQSTTITSVKLVYPPAICPRDTIVRRE